MSRRRYLRVLGEAERLPHEEQLLLIERLAGRLRHAQSFVPAAPRWEDYGGSGSHPLCGEEAQTWVSRTRQESDDSRRMP